MNQPLTYNLHGRRDADEHCAAAHPLCDLTSAAAGTPRPGRCAEGGKVLAVPVALPSGGKG